MKQTFTFFACLITTLCSAQTKWEKVEITPNLFVSFPAQPIKTEPTNGQKTFILRAADSTANYIVAATDLGILMGIDEATLSAEMDKEESWEQAKSAFMNSMGPDATLVKSEMTTLQGNKALKMIIERNNEKGAINTLTAFIFVKGTTTHNIMFNNRGGLADEKMKQQFFDSVEIK
jgi:hypothetical protein